MSCASITKERVGNDSTYALQQSRVYVIGTQVVYIQYDSLIDQYQNYLTRT